MAYKHICPVLAKVSADEPIFVLRAQDLSAPKLVRQWVLDNPQLSIQRRAEALRCADDMEKWPKRKPAD